MLLEDLTEKRARYEALRRSLLNHGQSVLACGCWHYDAYGLERLQGKLDHMKLLAEHMQATLADIQRIEGALLAP